MEEEGEAGGFQSQLLRKGGSWLAKFAVVGLMGEMVKTTMRRIQLS